MLDVWPFCDQERSLPPPIKITLPTFMAKKIAMKQSFFLFFLDNNQKIFRSNLVLEVVFVPESEGLYYLAVADPGEPVQHHRPPPTSPPPPPPYFKTKLRPGEGPKKIVWRPRPLPLIYGSAWPPPPPPPLSQGLHPTLSRITWHAGFNLYILETWWSS